MTTKMLKEINRSNASRNYLTHISEAARAQRALELEASLYGWRGINDKADDKRQDALEIRDEVDAARRLCDAIGGEEGEVLRRHYIDGRTYADLARSMYRSERTLKRLAMRGRVAMFDMLDSYWQHTVLAA